MSARRIIAVVLVLAAATGACRPHTVEVAAPPEPGATYAYRYEIETTVRRSVDGGPDEARATSSTLTATWEILPGDPDRAEVVVTGEDGTEQRVVVRVARPGLLAAVELDELAAETAAGELDRLVPPEALVPPARALHPGETWSIDEVVGDDGGPGELTGSGRLDRLDRVDGADLAVVTTVIELSVDTTLEGASPSELRGHQRGRATTAYDLADGAVRHATSVTTGDALAVVQPPPDVDADPVEVRVDYEVRARTTRL